MVCGWGLFVKEETEREAMEFFKWFLQRDNKTNETLKLTKQDWLMKYLEETKGNKELKSFIMNILINENGEYKIKWEREDKQ